MLSRAYATGAVYFLNRNGLSTLRKNAFEASDADAFLHSLRIREPKVNLDLYGRIAVSGEVLGPGCKREAA